MTMPYLMNCEHNPEGWCLDCVKKLQDERYKAGLTRAAEIAQSLEMVYAAGDSNILAENAGFSSEIRQEIQKL